MVHVLRLSRRGRWAVPAGGLVITGGVIAGSLISVAQAAPGLPARTPAQLLAEVATGRTTPPLTGTVVETASLGLPSLPATGNPTSISSLLTGSHTVRVWYASTKHYRLAAPSALSEMDLVRSGDTAWLWESTKNSVEEISLPTHAPEPVPTAPLTPQQAAQRVLAEVGPTTTVSVDTNVMVAGQAAYELVLAPKDSRSLVGRVRIAIDGRNGVPLRVEVFGRGATSPAIQVGYTAIQFVTPAPSELTFTPPPGATVTKVSMGAGSGKDKASGVSTIGSGWLTVLETPSSALNSGTSDSGPGKGGPASTAAAMHALLDAAAPVHGAWGSGRLLRTSLVSVLITDNGKVVAGAVEPSVLYAAAGSHP